MSNDEIIQKAISYEIGKKLKSGTIIACEQEDLSMTLIRYDGNKAICSHVNKGDLSIDRNLIFDVNKVKYIAKVIATVGRYNPESPPLVVSL